MLMKVNDITIRQSICGNSSGKSSGIVERIDSNAAL